MKNTIFTLLFSSVLLSAQAISDTGIVDRYFVVKGYGFIVADDDGRYVFVHHTSINGSGFNRLEKGQKVEYTLSEGPKGPEARGVRPSK